MNHGSLVEICSEDSVGQRMFLYHMIVHHLVKKKDISSISGVSSSGQVVYISTKYSFNVTQFSQMLHSRITEIGVSSENMACCLEKCREMIYLFFCNSSSDLLCTLASLETLISDHPDINLVFIDDIGSFYWADRHRASLASGKTYPDEVAKPLTSALSQLFANHPLAVVVSKPSLFTSNTEDTVEYMPSYWQKMVTHRIFISESGQALTSQKVVQHVYAPCSQQLSHGSSVFTLSQALGFHSVFLGNSLHTLFKSCNVLRSTKEYYCVQVPFGILNIHYK